MIEDSSQYPSKVAEFIHTLVEVEPTVHMVKNPSDSYAVSGSQDRFSVEGPRLDTFYCL